MLNNPSEYVEVLEGMHWIHISSVLILPLSWSKSVLTAPHLHLHEKTYSGSLTGLQEDKDVYQHQPHTQICLADLG